MCLIVGQLQYAQPFNQNLGSPLISVFYLHTTIWQKYVVLFLLIFFFVYDHSTKNNCPHWLISVIYTRPFYQNIWSSFIYSFFCARPFDQKLGPSFIYSFCFHTAIREKDIILFNLFFFLCTTIRPNIRVLINKFSYLYTTTRQKLVVTLTL